MSVTLFVIGSGGCGKDNLILALLYKKLKEGYVPTIVDKYKVKGKIEENELNITMVSLAGMEDFKAIREAEYEQVSGGTSLYILCYACNDSDSFANIQAIWHPETNGNATYLVGLKEDLYEAENNKHVSPEEADKLAQDLGCLGSDRCSAKVYIDNDIDDENGRIETTVSNAISAFLETKPDIISSEILKKNKISFLLDTVETTNAKLNNSDEDGAVKASLRKIAKNISKRHYESTEDLQEDSDNEM